MRRYVLGPGEDDPQVWYNSGTMAARRFLHADQQGSTIAVSDDAGLVGINSYDDYGKMSASAIGRYKYTGQLWVNEVGMYYYKARFYQPDIGRFMQTDPVGYMDQFNLYNYVGNDPTNKKDYSGTCTGSLFQDSDGNCTTQFGVGPADWDPNYGGNRNYQASPSISPIQDAAEEEAASICAEVPWLCLPVILSGDTSKPPAGVGSIPGDQGAQTTRNIVNQNLDMPTLHAARRELQGKVVSTKPGGASFDHVTKVRQAQQGLIARIVFIKKLLGNPNMTDGQRYYYHQELSDASDFLDFSRGFVP